MLHIDCSVLALNLSSQTKTFENFFYLRLEGKVKGTAFVSTV